MADVIASLVAGGAEESYEQWQLGAAGAHRSTCLRVARGMLHDGQLAEDAVQDAYLTAWRGRSRFDPERSVQRSWLLMLTYAHAVGRIRPSPRHGGAGLTEAVHDALGELPLEQRETIVLAYWGGHTQNEIAQLLDCPLSTVRARCLSGMRWLHQTLEAARAVDRAVAAPATARPVVPTPRRRTSI